MKFCLEILETLSYHKVETRSLYLAGLGTVAGRDRRQAGQNYRSFEYSPSHKTKNCDKQLAECLKEQEYTLEEVI